MSADQPVTTVVETLENASESGDVQLGDILDEFGSASFPPLLLTVSLLLVSPLSGVPFFSSLAGVAIFLVATQGALGRKHIWLPRRIKDWKLDTERYERAIHHVRRLATWLDKGTNARWAPLVTPPASRALYGICAVSGLFLPLLELIPLSSSLIGASVALISTALLARDGLIALLGLVALCVAATIPALAYWTLLA